MTSLSPAAGSHESGAGLFGPIRWRRLVSVTLRQHKSALAAYAASALIVAATMAVTGLMLHASGTDVFSAGAQRPLYDVTSTSFGLVLPFMPVLAGLFLGAPLVACEIESGTARFAWAQGVGRARWVPASVGPVALILLIVAAGLGLEIRWWVNALLPLDRFPTSGLFTLNPLPFSGWMLLSFSLGVFLGAAIRRTVPAMAVTLFCGLPGMYVALTRQRGYLPPLRQAAHATFSASGGYGSSVPLRSGPGTGQIISRALGWPDGRLLTRTQLRHPAAWFRAHHIQVWLTYQPRSRLLLFEWIEFGWLVALSAFLIGGTVLLVRHGAS
jgi:hypothetical protein